MTDPILIAKLAERTDEKLEAIQYIRGTLGLFECAGHPLDHWERVHLVDSVSLAWRGAYSMGAMHAHYAMTPKADRNEVDYTLPTDDIYFRADIPMLRKTLSH